METFQNYLKRNNRVIQRDKTTPPTPVTIGTSRKDQLKEILVKAGLALLFMESKNMDTQEFHRFITRLSA